MRPERAEGECLCGAVRFEVSLPSLFCAHCHCTQCRRAHGAAFVTWFGVDRNQLSVLSGKGNLLRYESSEHGSRFFCRQCGSALFFESTKRPDQADVVLANMRGPIDRDPELHVYVNDRAPWVVIGDDLPRFGGDSGLEPIPDDS